MNMMRQNRILSWIFFGFVCVFMSTGCATRSSRPPQSGPILAVQQTPEARAQSEGSGKSWVVSTQGRASSRAVEKVFNQGGNIIDAAIAASFSISVERPQSTGIGGGGFLLYREAKTGKIYAIDFRERAPSRAHERMYLDENGEVIPERSVYGLYSSGVPGLVRGLAAIHKKFGKLKFSQTVQPAIDLAQNGFEVYPYLAEALQEEKANLAKFSDSAKIFFKTNQEPYALGEKLIQKDLANTLRRISKTYGEDFYTGQTAAAIVKDSDRMGGFITKTDLKNYQVKWLTPVQGSYKGYTLFSMPPPSSGGTHVIEILNILEGFNLREDGFQTAQAVHKTASAMQMAFVDRARYMGDPAFIKVPVQTLTSKSYAAELRSKIQPSRVFRADQATSAMRVLPESSDTTHFSIMDQAGNVVVSTQTINGWFGSAWTVSGTGVLMNNEMDDFSAKPGAQNIFGAVGSSANAVQPGKTPLSSMSPTIVMRDQTPVLALGAPGGTRIINCVAQTILNYLEYGLPLYDSVAAVRFHHQWKPDELKLDSAGLSAETEKVLTQMGYPLNKEKVGCNVMAVSREGTTLRGVSDPRDFGIVLGH
jgi:gamma-glutamyltranspeptidase/glutathione hydrolase